MERNCVGNHSRQCGAPLEHGERYFKLLAMIAGSDGTKVTGPKERCGGRLEILNVLPQSMLRNIRTLRNYENHQAGQLFFSRATSDPS